MIFGAMERGGIPSFWFEGGLFIMVLILDCISEVDVELNCSFDMFKICLDL